MKTKSVGKSYPITFLRQEAVLFSWIVPALLLLLAGCGGGVSNRQVTNSNSNTNINSSANTVVGGSVTDKSGGTQSGETDSARQVSNPTYIPHGKANTLSTASQYPASNAASQPYSSSDPPEIWLEFPKPKQASGVTLNNADTIRVELSGEAKYSLHKYWYDLGTMTPTSGQRTFDDGAREVRSALLRTQIDAPEGRRDLAADEAESVLQTMQGTFMRLRRNGKQD